MTDAQDLRRRTSLHASERRTDLEKETIADVRRVLQAEFEKE